MCVPQVLGAGKYKLLSLFLQAIKQELPHLHGLVVGGCQPVVLAYQSVIMGQKKLFNSYFVWEVGWALHPRHSMVPWGPWAGRFDS